MTNQKVNTRYSPEARDIYFTVPNLISALRIISIPFISVLISKHEMIAALALIAISSASDGLDGIIARRFNQVSKMVRFLIRLPTDCSFSARFWPSASLASSHGGC